MLFKNSRVQNDTMLKNWVEQLLRINITTSENHGNMFTCQQKGFNQARKSFVY
jgi:hypothetical protein